MSGAFEDCVSVSAYCPVEQTIYGYYPSLGLNAFFVAIFSLLALLQIGLGAFYKTYLFSSLVIAGCLAETIGYGGRIMLHQNPWSGTGFNIQISCLIFAPSFTAAAIYVVFKNVVRTFGVAKSRIPANWYLVIFMVCDFIALLLQASGGGLAGSADGNDKQLNAGTDVMMAGIVFQVITMLVFIILVIDYSIRTRRSWDQVPSEARLLSTKLSTRLFLVAMSIALFTVFLRCIYRIAEMAKGWANPIMRDEISFVVLEGIMIVVAVIAMTGCHPGLCFPTMGRHASKNGAVAGQLQVEEVEHKTNKSSQSS